jgi:O-antigen ligase
LSYVLLLMVAAGLILSGSVGSILAAIVAISVWLAFNRVSIHALHVFATLAACVLALTTLQAIRGAPTPIDRFRSTTTTSFVPGSSQELGSVDQRIGTYRVNVARIKEDPFVGVGLDIYSVTRPFGQENDMYDSHNIIIGLWYKTGLVGLVGMLLAFFAIFQAGWRSMSASTSDAEWQLAVALVSSFAAFIVFAMSEPVLFSRFGWISAALVLALRSVQPARLPKPLRAAQGAERLRGARQVLAPSRP